MVPPLLNFATRGRSLRPDRERLGWRLREDGIGHDQRSGTSVAAAPRPCRRACSPRGPGALLLAVAALAQDVQPVRQDSRCSRHSRRRRLRASRRRLLRSRRDPICQPGFIDAFGRLLEQGAAKFKSDMQGAQENFDKLGKRGARRRQGRHQRIRRGLPRRARGERPRALRDGAERRARLRRRGRQRCAAARASRRGKSLDTTVRAEMPGAAAALRAPAERHRLRHRDLRDTRDVPVTGVSDQVSVIRYR